MVVQRSLEGKQDLDMEGAGQRGRLAQRVGDGGGRGVQTDQPAGRTGLGEGLCRGLRPVSEALSFLVKAWAFSSSMWDVPELLQWFAVYEGFSILLVAPVLARGEVGHRRKMDGQKVRSGVHVPSCGKNQMDILANPVEACVHSLSE